MFANPSPILTLTINTNLPHEGTEEGAHARRRDGLAWAGLDMGLGLGLGLGLVLGSESGSGSGSGLGLGSG